MRSDRSKFHVTCLRQLLAFILFFFLPLLRQRGLDKTQLCPAEEDNTGAAAESPREGGRGPCTTSGSKAALPVRAAHCGLGGNRGKHICPIYEAAFPGGLVTASVPACPASHQETVSVQTPSLLILILSLKLWCQGMRRGR